VKESTIAMNERIDLVLFDMDGTLTLERSPWEYLHRRLDLWASKGRFHLEDWLAGRIDYDEFFRLDVDLWRGMGKRVLLDILDGIGLAPGVLETLGALREAGVTPVILSTGFAHVGRRIEASAGFPLEIWANEFRFDESDRLLAAEMTVSGDPRSPRSKAALARAIMDRHGVSPGRTAAVGDSPGDTGMFGAAGFSLAVRGASGIGATRTLHEPDLRCCLPWLLGDRPTRNP